MLMIRLQRVGRKNDPSFRVVVTESQNAAKSGKFLEVVGSYDVKKGKSVVDGEKIKYWIGQGAQVSDTVHNMLVSKKVIEGKKIDVLPKKKEEAVPAPAPAAEQVAPASAEPTESAAPEVSAEGEASAPAEA